VKKAKFIHVLMMIIILFLAVENSDKVIQFFNNAETHLSKLGEFDYSNGFLIDENDLADLEDSGITGSEYTFDTKFYPYFDMLSIEGQVLYKQVYANMKELKTTFVPTLNITTEEVQKVMEAVFNDHPEFFWINTIYSYKYTENNIVVQITLEFNETVNDFATSKKEFDTVTNKILNEARKLSSEYEKELYVHDEILKLAKYNLNAKFNQSAYSALVTGETVCAGYARAFQYIMINLGIPTYYVSGYSSQDHAWNLVFIDGEYYNVYLTWNSTNHNHHYFNVTDNNISHTHKRKKLSTHLPSCTSNHPRYQNQNTSSSSNLNSTNINTTTPSINTNQNENTNNGYVEPPCTRNDCYKDNHHEEYHHTNTNNNYYPSNHHNNTNYGHHNNHH